MAKRNIKIKNTLFISLLITAAIAILTISLLWGYIEIKESKAARKHLKDESLAQQKEKLKREVNRILDYIKFAQTHHKNIPLIELQKDILEYISTVRFGSGGYIFVNKVDGQTLVFDGKKLAEYKNNIDLTDIHGKSIFAPQIEAFHKKEEGGYMQYYFKRIGGNKPESKIAYIKGFHEWEWIIGAGDYLRDIDKEILIHENRLKQNLKTRIIYIAILLAILIIGITYVSYCLSTYINREFAVFKNFFKHSSTGDLINLNLLSIFELQTIAETANKMINEIDETTFLLSESEKKYRTIIENSADAIFIIDAQANYLYTNKKATEMLGYSQKEFMSMNISDLVTQENKAENLESFQTLFREGKMSLETRFIHKDKSLVPMDLNAVSLPNGTFFGSCRDISQRKKAEAELLKHQTRLEEIVKQRTQELEEKNSELERFNKLFIGREFRIKELKDKLKTYEK